MWQELLQLAVSNGIWAVLFCCLLIYQLKDSKKRELKYQNTIDSLNSHLNIVRQIKDDVDEIREELNKNGRAA